MIVEEADDAAYAAISERRRITCGKKGGGAELKPRTPKSSN